MRQRLSDAAVEQLMAVMKQILAYIGQTLRLPIVTKFINSIPVSMYKLKKSLGLQKDNFLKSVDCPIVIPSVISTTVTNETLEVS